MIVKGWKRCGWVVLCCVLACVLNACASVQRLPQGEMTDTRPASLSRLTEHMPIDAAQADTLLDLLSTQGLEGEVLFAYPATDEDGRTYYHVWIGETTVDVYLSGAGQAAALVQAGVLIFGDLPVPEMPKDDEPGEEDESDTDEVVCTLTLSDHTATVALGETGYVRVLGTPGEQYKIKVYYASGVSSAKALSPRVAGEDGSLVWEWTVSRQVKPGVYKIEVVHAQNEKDKLVLPFEVVETNDQ